MKNNSEKHFKSMSCLHLQKQITKKTQQPHNCRKRSQPQFVAFQSQRKLGKLIVTSNQEASSRRLSNEKLVEKINFRNFGKIYNMVMKFQNKKYSEVTRATGQKDLINQQWKLNQISKLPQRRDSSFNNKKSTVLTKLSNYSSQKPPAKEPQFQKMNKYLFKKLSQVKQPQDNPQFHHLYANYIKVAQMNENIKRSQLTGKTKILL